MKLLMWMRKNKWYDDRLAEELGISQPTVNRIKHGKHRPGWPTMLALSRLTKRKVRPNDFEDSGRGGGGGS